MAQQTINVGASANDGTGSPLRTAFQYTNSNFTELYAALGGGSGLPGSTNQVLFNNGTAIAGDAGMTYNPSTDTMTLVNLVLSGTFAARNGDTPSAIRAAASDYAAVNFDGATASTRISSTLTGQSIGTGDFSIWCRFKISQTTAKAVFSVVEDANNYFGLTTSSGAYGLDKTIGGVASNATITGFTGAAFAGQIVDFVLVRSAGVFSVYVNGSAYTLTNTTGNISLSAAANLRVGGYFTASQVFDKRVYRSVVFNRALSASDVTELITLGVNPADQWGTQTDIINASTLNGGFETAGGGGADVFADWAEVTSGTSTINRDTSIFYAGTASCRFDLDVSGSSVSIQSATATFARNKRYRVSCFARSTATSGRLAVNVGASLFSPLGAVLDNASWQERVLEFVTESGGGNIFTISRLAGALNGSIWIDNVTFTRIGAIVDLDFTVGAGYQATDRSTNALHGTLFNGVEFSQPKRVAVLYATTNTNGNQQMLGTLAIPTNAVIEDIICNSTGSATVSIGNASAGTQIVNGASVVSGRQKLTLATPFSTTGNLWVNSNSTATLQFTILYTVAA
jgi:hypothetical protein